MKLFNRQDTKELRRNLRKIATPEEIKVWQIVRNRKILNLKFFRQYSVNKYILDFYCPQLKLCLEIDGGHHNLNNHDKIRTDYLNLLGISVIRFWNNDVNNNLEGVYQKIFKTAEELITNSPRPSLLKKRGENTQMNNLKVKNFEGPLDLLLSLIEQRQLDITTIAIAEVTEQFLQHIKQLEKVDPTSLADYLSIAAKLLVIKSKAILPSLEIEAEDEEVVIDLESRLILYKQFKEAVKYFKSLDEKKQQSFSRSLTFEQKISFFPDPNLTPDSLHSAILKIVNDLKELDSLPKAKVKEAISIQEKIDHLRNHLSGQIETKLSELFKTAKNKSEVVITFLALLELIKQRIFVAEQETLFSDVIIKKNLPTNS